MGGVNLAYAEDASGKNVTVSNETSSGNITGGYTDKGDASDNALTVTDSDASSSHVKQDRATVQQEVPTVTKQSCGTLKIFHIFTAVMLGIAVEARAIIP